MKEREPEFRYNEDGLLDPRYQNKCSNLSYVIEKHNPEIKKRTLLGGIGGLALSVGGVAIYNYQQESFIKSLKENKTTQIAVVAVTTSSFALLSGLHIINSFTNLRAAKRERLKMIKELEESIVEIQHDLTIDDAKRNAKIEANVETLIKMIEKFNAMEE
jgi:hypothetical protein